MLFNICLSGSNNYSRRLCWWNCKLNRRVRLGAMFNNRPCRCLIRRYQPEWRGISGPILKPIFNYILEQSLDWSWTPILNRSWTDPEPTLNRPWTDPEPILNRSWNIAETMSTLGVELWTGSRCKESIRIWQSQINNPELDWDNLEMSKGSELRVLWMMNEEDDSSGFFCPEVDSDQIKVSLQDSRWFAPDTLLCLRFWMFNDSLEIALKLATHWCRFIGIC